MVTLDDDGLLAGPLPALAEVDLDQLQDQDGVLSIDEAAMLARVSVPAVRRWVQRRQVFAFEWDGSTWIGRRSLLDCERARRRAPQGRPRTLAPGAADARRGGA